MSKTVNELTEIEHQLAKAWAAGDSSVHESILHDDWSVIDPGGTVLDKQKVIATSFTAKRDIEKAVIDDIKIRDFSDWALVTGRTQISGMLADHPIDIVLRFTDVFRLINGEWRCIASHGTPVQAAHQP